MEFQTEGLGAGWCLPGGGLSFELSPLWAIRNEGGAECGQVARRRELRPRVEGSVHRVGLRLRDILGGQSSSNTRGKCKSHPCCEG